MHGTQRHGFIRARQCSSVANLLNGDDRYNGVTLYVSALPIDRLGFILSVTFYDRIA